MLSNIPRLSLSGCPLSSVENNMGLQDAGIGGRGPRTSDRLPRLMPLPLDGVSNAPDVLDEPRVLGIVTDLLTQVNRHKDRFSL